MCIRDRLWSLSATAVSELVQRREVSAVEVTRSVLARISAVNPAINAVVQEFPDAALEDAALVDKAIARGETLGPLTGVPITIKVVVDQAGYATTNGLLTRENLIAEVDNPVVENLRKSGAIIVGRTNTPAFSLHWFTRNRVHGHTRNPRNPMLTPGGSSGGAAAAVAAAPAAGGAAPAEEKSEFTIMLAAAGDKKINVIKEIRAVTSLGLKEAKDLVEGAPKEVKSGVNKKEAEEIKAKLEAAGAKVELK